MDSVLADMGDIDPVIDGDGDEEMADVAPRAVQKQEKQKKDRKVKLKNETEKSPSKAEGAGDKKKKKRKHTEVNGDVAANVRSSKKS